VRRVKKRRARVRVRKRRWAKKGARRMTTLL
jgi:hypothetical protein